MDFKAEKIGNQIVVKAKVIKDGKNVTIKVPNLKMIEQLRRDFLDAEWIKQNGKRDI